MIKMLCILMAVLALGAVIDCKIGLDSGTTNPDLCSIVGCVNGENNLRQKRANGRAVEILGGVERLITGILNSTLGHIGRTQKPNGEERVTIGGGSYNDNTVTLDDSDYE